MMPCDCGSGRAAAAVHQVTDAEKRLLSSLPDSIIGSISSTVSRDAFYCTERFFEIAFIGSGLLCLRFNDNSADAKRQRSAYASALSSISVANDYRPCSGWPVMKRMIDERRAHARRLVVSQLYAVRARGAVGRGPFRLFLRSWDVGTIDQYWKRREDACIDPNTGERPGCRCSVCARGYRTGRWDTIAYSSGRWRAFMAYALSVFPLKGASAVLFRRNATPGVSVFDVYNMMPVLRRFVQWHAARPGVADALPESLKWLESISVVYDLARRSIRLRDCSVTLSGWCTMQTRDLERFVDRGGVSGLARVYADDVRKLVGDSNDHVRCLDSSVELVLSKSRRALRLEYLVP